MTNNNPQGDPDKLAQLIIEVAELKNPPLHLPIGADAPSVLDSYAEQIKADTNDWQEKAEDTLF